MSLLDLAGAEEARTLWTQPGVPVRALAWSTDESLLASGGDDGSVTVWEVGAGRERARRVLHAGYVGSLAFLPRGHVLVSGGKDGLLRLWDLSAGGDPVDMGRHPGSVSTLACHPAGEAVVAGGEDGDPHFLGPRPVGWRSAASPRTRTGCRRWPTPPTGRSSRPRGSTGPPASWTAGTWRRWRGSRVTVARCGPSPSLPRATGSWPAAKTGRCGAGTSPSGWARGGCVATRPLRGPSPSCPTGSASPQPRGTGCGSSTS